MSFFTAYVRDDKAKMAAAFWAEDALSHSIGNYHTENTSIQFLKDQIQEGIRLCSPAKMCFAPFSIEPFCGRSWHKVKYNVVKLIEWTYF